jgi:hypothetical protein
LKPERAHVVNTTHSRRLRQKLYHGLAPKWMVDGGHGEAGRAVVGYPQHPWTR